MTEIYTGQVERKLNFNKLIKLSISGGGAKEQSTTLKLQLKIMII